MKKRLLSGLVGPLAAQPALSLNLVETYEKALSYDSGIAAARASFEAQQAASDVSRINFGGIPCTSPAKVAMRVAETSALGEVRS